MTKLDTIACIFTLFVVTHIKLYAVLGNLGGHAVFASLSQLEDLWQNEIIIVQILEKMVEMCGNSPTSVNM